MVELTKLVDIIRYLESVDDTTAGVSIFLIMILQSPILTFPGYILMIYSGYKFGLLTGAILNFVGLYLSCILGYRFGRWSSSDMSKSSNPRILKFHELVQKQGIKVIALLRILPLIPNNFTSIGSGLTRVPEKQHAYLSVFSILQSFFWSFLGAYLLKTVISDLSLEITVYHIFMLVLILSLLLSLRIRFNRS